MREFVFCNNDGVVQFGQQFVTTHRGEVWSANDPFVLSRPDLFSYTPVVVRNTLGTEQPEPKPLVERATRKPGERRGVLRRG